MVLFGVSVLYGNQTHFCEIKINKKNYKIYGTFV